MVVKMNQPCVAGVRIWRKRFGNLRHKTYHEEESDRVGQCLGSAGGFDVGFNFESAGTKQDGKGDPESTVRGQGGSTESVANGHLPVFVPICQTGWAKP